MAESTYKHLKIGRVLSLFFFLMLAMLISPNLSYGQKPGDVVPDGTEGEMLDVVKGDTLPAKWKDQRWRLFPGKFSSLQLGGGFLYEFAGYSQNEAGKQQMDSIGTELKSAFEVRDFRLTASGKLTTKRSIIWKVGLMYDGVSNSWLVRETGLMVGVPELSGSIFVGRTKEGFSMNKVMVGYAGWTMERQMAIDVIPILADGVKWLGFLPKPRIFWNIGVYTDWLSKGQSFSTYKWQLATRIGWLPVYSPADNTVLHIGFNYRYGVPVDDQIRVRSKPEANPAPRFIDTDTFPTNYSHHIGGEVYYNSGPWMFGSEVYMHHFNSPKTGNPVFVGGDVVVAYIITGESRPYNTATSIFGFVPVNKSVFKGGPGAWEVLLRYSTLNLNGGTIKGGKFWRITPMVNWYLSPNVRLELTYGYGMLDRYNLMGATQFFQSRIQLTL